MTTISFERYKNSVKNGLLKRKEKSEEKKHPENKYSDVFVTKVGTINRSFCLKFYDKNDSLLVQFMQLKYIMLNIFDPIFEKINRIFVLGVVFVFLHTRVSGDLIRVRNRYKLN